MEKINKKIGIFILNYNGLKWLKNNLSNIVLNSANAEITIVDNNSKDDSINYLETNFPQINIIKHTKNYGFSKAYNKVLLNNFCNDFFVIMNNDVKVTNNWLQPMLHLIQKPNIGIVQPKIMNSERKKYFDYAGAAGGFIDIYGIPFCRGRIINNIESDLGQYEDSTQIFWASGCCLMIKREVFQMLNGFDEDFFMHQEEIDLCWRAQELNIESYYCSKSTIYHYGGGTLQSNNPMKNYYNHRNNLLLLIKNMSLKLLAVIVPLRILMDYILILYYFISGTLLVLLNTYQKSNRGSFNNLKTSFMILFAHLSILVMLPKFIKKRSPVKTKKIYKNSILFDYYLRCKKTFLELNDF